MPADFIGAGVAATLTGTLSGDEGTRPSHDVALGGRLRGGDTGPDRRSRFGPPRFQQQQIDCQHNASLPLRKGRTEEIEQKGTKKRLGVLAVKMPA